MSTLVRQQESDSTEPEASPRAEVWVGRSGFCLRADGTLDVTWEDPWSGPGRRRLRPSDVAEVRLDHDKPSAAHRVTRKLVLVLADGPPLVTARYLPADTAPDAASRVAALLARPLNMRAPESAGDAGRVIRHPRYGSATVRLTRDDVVVELPGSPHPRVITTTAAGLRLRDQRGAEQTWPAAHVFDVRAEGKSLVLTLYDGTRVELLQNQPREVARRAARHMRVALRVPSRPERIRRYLQGQDAPAAFAAAFARPVAAGADVSGAPAAAVLPYDGTPVDAPAVRRGPGYVRISVPPLPFLKGWTHWLLVLSPMLALLAVNLLIMGGWRRPPGQSLFNGLLVVGAWAAAAACFAARRRTEVLLTEEALEVETHHLLGRRVRRWPPPRVEAIEAEWRVLVLKTAKSANVRFLYWHNQDDLATIRTTLRAALGLAPPPAPAAPVTSTVPTEPAAVSPSASLASGPAEGV